MERRGRIGSRLKLRQLEILFAVAEGGSMGKAAAQLSVSQPVISKAIADLELTLGVRLLDRGPHGVEPTLYGRALIRRSIAVFDELKQGVRDIKFLADPTTGEVKLACPEAWTVALLPEIVQKFFEQYPGVVLHVETVPNPADFPGLHDRRYDLYVTVLPQPEERVPQGLNVEFLFNDQFVVAAGTHHRLARRRRVDLADLVNERWILPSGVSTQFIYLDEAFRAQGLVMPKISLWSRSPNLWRHLIANGPFVWAGSKSTADCFSLKVLPVVLPMRPRPWLAVVVTLKNRTLSPVVALFIDFLRDFTKPMRAATGATPLKWDPDATDK